MKGSLAHTVVLGIGLLSCVAAGPGPQDKMFVLQAGEYTTLELIEKSGEFLGRSYNLDLAQAPELQNPDSRAHLVRLTGRLELDAAACEEVISQLLFAKNWVCVPLDRERGLYDWIWMQGPRGSEIRQHPVFLTPEALLQRPKLMDWVTTSVALQHVNPMMAGNNLRALYNDPRGLTNIAPVGDNPGSLVLTGIRPQVCAMLHVLQDIDRPGTVPSGLEQRVQQLEARLAALEAKLKAIAK